MMAACDHRAGVNVSAGLVVEHDQGSGFEPGYVLDIVSVTCRACGRPFMLGGEPTFGLKIEPAPAPPLPPAVELVTLDDFEAIGPVT